MDADKLCDPRVDDDGGGPSNTATDASIENLSKKDRLRKAMEQLAIKLEGDDAKHDGPDESASASISEEITSDNTNTMVDNCTNQNSSETSANDSVPKSPDKLTPAPPRWRFVKEAKSTLGYSSTHAGVFVRGKSSLELGAKYNAPEITKDVKVRTIEKFELVAPEEHQPEQKKERDVGQLAVRECDESMEDFAGDGEFHHQPEISSPQATGSRSWKQAFPPPPTETPFARKDGGEWFGYEHDPTPNPKVPPQFDQCPPGDDSPKNTHREVGKLKFNSPDSMHENFEGSIPKRTLSTSIYNEDTAAARGGGLDGDSTNHEQSSISIDNGEFTENTKPTPTHLYMGNSIPTTGISDGGGSTSDNGFEQNSQVDDFYMNDSGKAQSAPTRKRHWKRYRWLLVPLLLFFAIIVGSVVGKKRSSEGDNTAPTLSQGVILFAANETSSPSQSPSMFANSADTDTNNASPLFSRPTFLPTSQPSSYPSLTSAPSKIPSDQPSVDPSRIPSFYPTSNPSIAPSLAPSVMPSSDPTSDPSISPSAMPSESPTQLPSLSASPTITGTVEPSFSLEPTSSHPTTASPSKQPIIFAGGCPEPFQPFVSYNIGTEISRDGIIYQCIGTSCGSLTYAPGGLSSDLWRETWEVVGACNGTKLPTLAPTAFPSLGPTSMPSTSVKPTKQPIIFIGGCPDEFQSFNTYDIGSKISADGIVYECISQFCGSLGLLPGASSSDWWRDTWMIVGACEGTIEPTSGPTIAPSLVITETPSTMPTPAPLFPTMMPTDMPTLEPTVVPTKEPSQTPTKFPTLKPVIVPTPMPTCPPQNGDFNLCVSIDMSGSVCGGGQCAFCEPLSTCNSFGINIQRCCNNFDNVLEFTKALVRQLGDLKTQQDFSLVHFATSATIASTLQNANQAIKTLHQVEYTGGSTNLGEGIKLCQQTLDFGCRKEESTPHNHGWKPHHAASKSRRRSKSCSLCCKKQGYIFDTYFYRSNRGRRSSSSTDERD